MSNLLSSTASVPTSTDVAKQKYNKDNNNPPTQNNSAVGTLPGSPVGFIVSILGQIFYIVILVSIGSIMLHYCRVAQSNILPTMSECTPYTYKSVENPSFSINQCIDMNIVKNTELGNLSTKIYFGFDNNELQDKWPFRPLFNMIYGKSANIITRYIALTIQGCLFLNITMINTFFNFINSCCSETVIIFIMPFFLFISIIPLFIFNGVYLMIMYLYNVILLKDTASPANVLSATGKQLDQVKQEWKITALGSIWSVLTIYCGLWGYLIVFIILFGWAFAALTGVIVAIYSMILPLLMKANVVETRADEIIKTEKFYTIGNTFWDVWKYKLSIIMYVISFNVISGAFSAYGIYTGFCVFIGCILLYHFTSIYERYIPIIKDANGIIPALPSISTTNLISDQLTKHCSPIIEATVVKADNKVQTAVIPPSAQPAPIQSGGRKTK